MKKIFSVQLFTLFLLVNKFDIVYAQSCNVIAGTISALKDTICLDDSLHMVVYGSSAPVQWQSSDYYKNTFTNLTGAIDTIYSTSLSQTTYFRVIADNGTCKDTSAYLKIVVASVPTDDFIWNASGLMVTFNSGGSLWAVIKNWDFGDGESDINNHWNPIHTYDTIGTYNVCLTVSFNSGCSFIVCHDVVILPDGINNISQQNITVYPNPATSNLFINSNSKKIELKDLLGHTIYQQSVTGSGSLNQTENINVSQLSTGIYFAVLRNEDGSAVVRKFVKE